VGPEAAAAVVRKALELKDALDRYYHDRNIAGLQ
jgi:hypothetical protein